MVSPNCCSALPRVDCSRRTKSLSYSRFSPQGESGEMSSSSRSSSMVATNISRARSKARPSLRQTASQDWAAFLSFWVSSRSKTEGRWPFRESQQFGWSLRVTLAIMSRTGCDGHHSRGAVHLSRTLPSTWPANSVPRYVCGPIDDTGRRRWDGAALLCRQHQQALHRLHRLLANGFRLQRQDGETGLGKATADMGLAVDVASVLVKRNARRVIVAVALEVEGDAPALPQGAGSGAERRRQIAEIDQGVGDDDEVEGGGVLVQEGGQLRLDQRVVKATRARLVQHFPRQIDAD